MKGARVQQLSRELRALKLQLSQVKEQDRAARQQYADKIKVWHRNLEENRSSDSWVMCSCVVELDGILQMIGRLMEIEGGWEVVYVIG